MGGEIGIVSCAKLDRLRHQTFMPVTPVVELERRGMAEMLRIPLEDDAEFQPFLRCILCQLKREINDSDRASQASAAL